MKNEQDYFEVLGKLVGSPIIHKGELADKLGSSLGKLNYCLKVFQKRVL